MSLSQHERMRKWIAVEQRRSRWGVFVHPLFPGIDGRGVTPQLQSITSEELTGWTINTVLRNITGITGLRNVHENLNPNYLIRDILTARFRFARSVLLSTCNVSWLQNRFRSSWSVLILMLYSVALVKRATDIFLIWRARTIAKKRRGLVSRYKHYLSLLGKKLQCKKDMESWNTNLY